MRFLVKLICLFLFCFMVDVEAIIITEIMYDPEGKDNNKEYIEVYTEDRLDYYILEDLSSVDTLQLERLVNSSYSLIVEEGFNHSGINATIYTVGKTIGNGLNNQRDLLLLRDTSSKIVDAVLYSHKEGGSGNGMALCRGNEAFYECFSSPGEVDYGREINTTYDLVITEFLPNPEGDDRAPMPEGEWVEVYNDGKDTVDLRGFVLEDNGNHSIVLSDVNFRSSPLVEPGNYLTIYLNGKLLLNNNGFEKVRISFGGELLDEVSYDDSREAVSWAKHPDNYFVLAKPTEGKENSSPEEGLETNISIETVHLGRDGKASFGEQIRVRLRIVKGDTSKNQVKMYVKGVTKQTTFSLYTKLQEYVVTVPLQLPANCKKNYLDGVYDLVVDGFGVKIVELINVSGNNEQFCIKIKENVTLKQKSVSLKSIKGEESKVISSVFVNQTGELVYESNDVKTKRYALYFFCLVMIFIVGAYVFHLEN